MNGNEKTLTQSEMRSAQVSLLVSLTDFLDSHGLRYSLHAGTLLGAVRHSGFIPWDDDVDIAMPRPDYEEFRRISSQMPDPLYLQDWRDPNYAMRFGKVCRKDIIARSPVGSTYVDYHLWVDVFPIDGACENEHRRRLLYFRALLNNKLYAYSVFDPAVAVTGFKYRLFSMYQAIPGHSILRKVLQYDHLRTISRVSYDDAKYVTTALAAGMGYWVMDKAMYDIGSRVTFEGVSFSCYNNKDLLLKMWYGDYMELPPEECRESHGTVCWYV